MRRGGASFRQDLPRRRVPSVTLLFALIAQLWAQSPHRIAGVEFPGLPAGKTPEIPLQSFPGALLDRRALRADVERLRATGLYADSIAVSLRSSGEGPIVLFHLQALPLLLEDPVFRGVPPEGTSELLAELGLQRGMPAQPARVHAAAESLRARLRAAGHAWCMVGSELIREEEGSRLGFRVSPGPVVRVGKVRFSGNEKLSDDRMLEALRGMPASAMTGEAFERAAAFLTHFYRSEGFLDARVWVGSLERKWLSGEVDVGFCIDEGEPYGLCSVELPPGLPGPDRGLLPGGRFLPSEQSRYEELLLAHLDEKGYFAAELHSVARLVGADSVDLAVSVDRGKRFTIGKITVRGNWKTSLPRILDSIPLRPNRFPPEAWRQRTLRALLGPHLFDSVGIVLLASDTGESRDVELRVREAWTRRIFVSGSLNEVAGPLGEVGIEETNFDITRLPGSFADIVEGRAFAGGGQDLKLSGGIGEDRMRGRVRYLYPRIAESDFHLTVSGKAELRELEAHTELEYGGWLGVSRTLLPRMSVQLKTSLRELRLREIDSLAAIDLLIDRGSHILWDLDLAWRWDGRRLSPLTWRGGLLSAELGVGMALEDDEDIARAALRCEWGTPLPGPLDDLSLELRSGFDWVRSLSSSRVPLYFREFLGGRRLLRGFSYRGAGPRDGGIPIGGAGRATISADVSFPLLWEHLRGSVFVAGGILTEEWQKFSGNELRLSAGGGLRFSIPGVELPVLLDMAIPLQKQREDEEELFSFSFQLLY